MILDFEPGDKVYNPSAKEWVLDKFNQLLKRK